MDHAFCCKKGGGFYRVHGSECRALGAICKEAGCEVNSEEVIPELLKGEPGAEDAIEARLDLHVWAPHPHPAEWFVDITHHHVWAERNKKRRLAPGAVAADAEADKAKRYGPGVGGIHVTPAAVESWGRLGVAFEGLLKQLCARWAAVWSASAAASAATGRRWRAELGIAQIRALHVTCCRATGTSFVKPKA